MLPSVTRSSFQVFIWLLAVVALAAPPDAGAQTFVEPVYGPPPPPPPPPGTIPDPSLARQGAASFSSALRSEVKPGGTYGLKLRVLNDGQGEFKGALLIDPMVCVTLSKRFAVVSATLPEVERTATRVCYMLGIYVKNASPRGYAIVYANARTVVVRVKVAKTAKPGRLTINSSLTLANGAPRFAKSATSILRVIRPAASPR